MKQVANKLNRHYAVPTQLDHTVVEILLEDGRWVFADPTYGVIFTDTGQPSSKILSTVEVTSGVEKLPLQMHVIQANRREDVSYLASLEQLYGNHFVQRGMSLSSYQSSEALSHNMRHEIVALEIPLVASNTQRAIGAFESTNAEVLKKSWERFAAQTFGPASSRRPSSPVASDLSNDREDVLTVFGTSALRPDENYELRLRLVNNQRKPQALQWGRLGRDVELGSDTIVMASPGVSTVGLSFVAREPAAKIYIHNLERRGIVNLYAAKLANTH